MEKTLEKSLLENTTEDAGAPVVEYPSEDEIRANRQTWIKALRGELGKKYSQHQNALAGDRYRSFCCLGVACEVLPALEVHRIPGSGGQYSGPYGVTLSGTLGYRQCVQLGINDAMMDFLVMLNDEYKAPFNVIATVVEELPVLKNSDDRYYEFDQGDFVDNTPSVLAVLNKYRTND